MAAVLDLSRRSFTNTSEIVKVCRWNNQIEQLFLRDVAVNPRTLWGDETPEQTGDIRAIKEVCPLLKYVDISGCDDSVKELLFSRSLHVQESRYLLFTCLSYVDEAKLQFAVVEFTPSIQ